MKAIELMLTIEPSESLILYTILTCLAINLSTRFINKLFNSAETHLDVYQKQILRRKSSKLFKKLTRNIFFLPIIEFIVGIFVDQTCYDIVNCLEIVLEILIELKLIIICNMSEKSLSFNNYLLDPCSFNDLNEINQKLLDSLEKSNSIQDAKTVILKKSKSEENMSRLNYAQLNQNNNNSSQIKQDNRTYSIEKSKSELNFEFWARQRMKSRKSKFLQKAHKYLKNLEFELYRNFIVELATQKKVDKFTVKNQSHKTKSFTYNFISKNIKNASNNLRNTQIKHQIGKSNILPPLPQNNKKNKYKNESKTRKIHLKSEHNNMIII
jgi:hypothetical protein